MLSNLFTATAATNATPSDTTPPYFFYAVLIGLLVLMFLSQRKRKKAAEQVKSSIVAGAHVMLTSGIFGKIVSINEDRVKLDLGSTVIEVAKGAVSRVVDAPAATPKAKPAAKPAAKKTKPASEK